MLYNKSFIIILLYNVLAKIYIIHVKLCRVSFDFPAFVALL